jgi:hypothetical protein
VVHKLYRVEKVFLGCKEVGNRWPLPHQRQQSVIKRVVWSINITCSLYDSINFLKGHAMTQDLICWPVTTEAQLESHANLYGTCNGQSDKGIGFSLTI